MKLKDLLNEVEVLDIKGNVNVEINSLSLDSNTKNKNSLFFCYKGVKADGHNFFQTAESNGAKALIVEKFLPSNLTQIKVKNTRKCISKICGNFYGNPGSLLKIFGVSGTNGKTTTTYILREIFKAAGHKVGLIGTTAIYINEIFYPASLTTPDPPELHRLFAQMVQAGCDVVIMEVSAHAIDLLKVYGITFEVGIFTNLTQDHLDYFGSMEAYAAAKQKFFNSAYCKSCVINIDDTFGKTIFDKCDVKKLTYGLINNADCFATELNLNLKGSRFLSSILNEKFPLEMRLPGKFNVYNCLAAVAACRLFGVNVAAIARGIEQLVSVEGRFNVIDGGEFEVVIDYAHTPDGLENILKNVKSLISGNLICVFGCGGNRDGLKRPLMGKIACLYSDTVIITSDNPRYENPLDILSQIRKGIDENVNFFEIENRREAIEKALCIARQNDAVVICGKGAEDYQEINGIKYPFKDNTIVQEYLSSFKLNINRG